MRTFTQLKKRSFKFMGINPLTDQDDVTFAIQDINDAQRIIEASARRFWTRGQFTANLVAGQQYYTLPAEVMRITTVRANTGGESYQWPLDEVTSEMLWNKFNIIPSNTVIVPLMYFVRGANEFGLYPIPSVATNAGVIVSAEVRANDMGIDDVITTSVTVTNGSQFITSPSVEFPMNMIGMVFSTTDGSDGKWYRVAAATASQLTLENFYEGPTETLAPCIIGQAPLFPEAYHMACAYYAAAQFYSARGDDAAAIDKYTGLFNSMLDQYRQNYAVKTTGVVMKPMGDDTINRWWITPQGDLQA